MEVIILGSGKIGSVIAKDFSKTGVKITLSDVDIKRAKKAAAEIGGDYTVFDTSDYRSMVDTLSEYDLVLGALPGNYGTKALEACVETGKSVVDVSFTPEDPSELDSRARDAGIIIIPDCGVAPGLSNLLVGYGASHLDKVDEAKIMVGGIPEKPVPPIGYTVTWSADGLIDEYVRDVSIIKNGKIVQTPALSGLEKIEFPGVGTLEAFYTDGLRSLVKSFPEAKNLYEKTLRYPGHVEKVKLLRELGFFSEEPIKVEGSDVNPKLVSARIFERNLTMPDVGDLLAMMIEVSGMKDGEKKGYRFTVLEYYDHDTGVSAMARTTAYTASIVAGILVNGGIKEKGVIPMEKLGYDHEFFGKVFKELGKREIDIIETEIT
jgi:saccharopine dehydrogenase-like NADP-dependent oxidoreductase